MMKESTGQPVKSRPPCAAKQEQSAWVTAWLPPRAVQVELLIAWMIGKITDINASSPRFQGSAPIITPFVSSAVRIFSSW